MDDSSTMFFDALAELVELLGEGVLTKELNLVGWRSIQSHPVAFFTGYLSAFSTIHRQQVVDSLMPDLEKVADSYGYDIADGKLIDIIPR